LGYTGHAGKKPPGNSGCCKTRPGVWGKGDETGEVNKLETKVRNDFKQQQMRSNPFGGFRKNKF
jgi:hypothetical protein